MAQSDRKAVTGIFLLVLFFFIIFMVFAVYTFKTLQGDIETQNSSKTFESKDAPIGVIEVEGVIMDSKDTIKKLHLAEVDDKVKAIIMRIDSPGGAVGPTQEIYQEIRRINEKKPVYAHFGMIAASGGYYIGAATRKIYSTPGVITGSIGVIMSFMNMSKLYEWAKLSQVIIKGGKYKDIGSPHREMTAEEALLMNDMIQNVHQQFRQDILKTRKEKIIGNLEDHSQGQVFSGEQALKVGLVDQLGSLWDAGRSIHEELKIEGDFKLKFIKLKEKFDFNSFFGEIEESMSNLRFGNMSSAIPMFLYSP